MIINELPSPCYVIEEKKLRENLSLIRYVAQTADVEIILAFKAFAMWKVFPIIREYIEKSTASSLAEAYLAFEQMGSKAHTYAPVYAEQEFEQIAKMSSYITFNSLNQANKFYDVCQNYKVSCGLRINPEYSAVKTDLYNPAKAGSRLGVAADLLPEYLPEYIEGLHFHTLCESTSYELQKTLDVVEKKFGKYLSKIKWLNMGGGHLITHKDYDYEHLIKILKIFKSKYPHLNIILEPGSAFVWQAGFLIATVEDIVENQGIKTAMLNVSFACHMPDCLEMPYQPEIREPAEKSDGTFSYRMGGNSCLSGDFIGDWHFKEPLRTGQQIIFEDMMHYTTVKSTMFNGVSHPSIGILKPNGNFEMLREFGYEDYKNRMN
jgi:carboxynorspermidine decarboxylase